MRKWCCIQGAGGTDDEMSNIDFDNVTVNNFAAVFMSNGTIDDSNINHPLTYPLCYLLSYPLCYLLSYPLV